MSASQDRDAATCDGSGDCKAVTHIHGCFADTGNCDDPGEHMAPGFGKFLNKLAKQEADSMRDAATERMWVPDRKWTTEPEIIDGKRCRMRGCKREAVAALARSNGWWCYCDEHLYGRRISDGVVETPVAAASPAAERGFTR